MQVETANMAACKATPELLRELVRNGDRRGEFMILTDDAEVGEVNASFAPAYDAPVATWPPGDDPSWSEDMPLAPVDQTADELAEEMKK